MFVRGHVYQAEAEEGTDAGSAGVVDTGAADAQVVAPVSGETGLKGPEQKLESDMLGAIKAGLAPVEDAAVVDDKAKAADAKVTADGKPVVDDPAKKDAADADAKAKADDKAKDDKPKKADDLALTDLEKKGLSPVGRDRFQKLITLAKDHEATIERQTAELTQALHGRDQFLGMLKEHHCEPADLAGYMEFNKLIKTGDLEGALKTVEDYRASLYKALGREAPGVDLLADQADLKARVDKMEISREDALVIANSRRAEAQRTAQANQQQEQQTQSQAAAQEQEAELQAIEKWTAGISKSDIDYKAKEAKLLPQITEIISTYPPKLWLTTLKTVYNAIQTPAAAPASRAADPVIRSSGTKPGAAAPTTMIDALKNAGIGQRSQA